MTTGAPGGAAAFDATCDGLLSFIADREDAPALAEARDGACGAWLTRSALRARVAEISAGFGGADKGLAFVLVRNDIATVAGILAARALGHAVALLDAKAPPEALVALLDAYDPEFVVFAGDPPVAFDAVATHHGISIGQRSTGRVSAPHADLALLLSTSGTTGSAKFVRLSGDAVVTNARQIARALQIEPTDVGVGHLALHYSYGWSVLSSHFVSGAAVALMDDSIMSPTFWPTIAAAGGTQFPGVPFHYTALARFGLNVAPPCVTSFTQAGGALDLRFQTKIHEQAAARGARFFVMYGQTEAAPRITTLPSDVFGAKTGSVGVALEGGTLSVVGEQGEALPAGDIGHVIYAGANVMMGYATGRDDLALGDEQDGRLETGDLGYLDSDGFLFLTGRSKRISKIFGLRISLDEIEARLSEGGPCAALDANERIVVFHEPEAGEMRARLSALAEALGLPSVAFKAQLVDSLPRKTSGKLDYNALKELL